MGWFEAGPVLLRLDIAERIAAELAHATRRRCHGLARQTWHPGLSIRGELLPAVLRALGVRVVHSAPALEPGVFGPPAPPMLVAPRRAAPRVRQAPEAAAVRPDNPFAALAALRRSP